MHRAALALAVALAALTLAGSALAAPPTQNQVPRFWFRTTVVVHPGDSIQAAINAARPYTRIVVLPGTYREEVTILKDGITLDGMNAVLMPPAIPAGTACDQALGGENGVCINGQLDNQGNVTRPVLNVGVTGLTITGFTGSGIVAFGATDASFTNNTADDDGGYGIAAFVSSGTWVASNRASGNQEAGIYIGDSPDARATLERNTAWNNGFGFFIRDAEGVTMTWNEARYNCAGVVILADAPGPAGNVTAALNTVVHNNTACPASEDSPPVSGIGFALVGANDSTLTHNEIKDNRPTGPSIASGGVALFSGGPTPPMDNTVTGNFLAQNDPDIFWDGSGSGNVLQPNSCFSSVPAGLC